MPWPITIGPPGWTKIMRPVFNQVTNITFNTITALKRTVEFTALQQIVRMSAETLAMMRFPNYIGADIRSN